MSKVWLPFYNDYGFPRRVCLERQPDIRIRAQRRKTQKKRRLAKRRAGK